MPIKVREHQLTNSGARNELTGESFLKLKIKTVHRLVRAMHLRLMDFPDKWSYHLYVVSETYDAKRGKWIIV
jgi:hypothetical protein